jgi:hypothetical protein
MRRMDEMLDPMGGLLMSPEFVEIVPDGPWIRRMQRVTGRETLFVYRHKGTGSFIVADWVVKPERLGEGIAICDELMVLDDVPDHDPSWLPTDDEMRTRCRPVREVIQEMRRNAKARQKEEREKAEADWRASFDAAAYLRRRGLDTEAALAVESGMVGGSREGEEGELVAECEEILRDAASTKVISHARERVGDQDVRRAD